MAIYLWIATPLLLAFCFLIQPFQAPDEPAHFFRAVQLSHGSVMPVLAASHDAAGAPVEQGAVELAHGFRPPSAIVTRYSPAEVVRRLDRPAGPRVFAEFNNTVIYFPPPYMGSALGVLIARAAGAPPLVWFYAARLMNVLLALGVTAAALAVFRERGLLPLIAGLLPMTLFEEASLSADAVLLPFAFLLTAILCEIAMGRPGRGWRDPVLLLSLLVTCVGKIAYIPLAFLPPVVAWAQGQRRGEIAKLAAFSALTLGAWVAWAFVVRHQVFNIRPGVHVDVDEQLALVIALPVAAAKIILGSMAHDASHMAKLMVGSNMGWFDVVLPRLLVDALIGVLALGVVLSRPVPGVRLLSRATVLAGLAGCALAIYGLIYLQYNAVGAPEVDGVQGRYFTPLVPLLLLLLPPIPLWRGVRERGGWVLVGLCALGSVAALAVVTLFYWRV